MTTKSAGIAPAPAGQSIVALGQSLIATAEAAADHELAYRQFIQLSDDIRATAPEGRAALVADGPEDTDSRWNDAFAALVEYHLVESGAPIPQWVTDRTGDPSDRWEPQRYSTPLPFPADLTEVAAPFLRRGILIEENELASV